MALKVKRVVVVGGSSGIGLATAKAIAEQGAAVVITGRSERKLRAAQEQVKGEVESRVADFTSEEQARGFFDQIGRFDHLVLTAGGSFGPGSFVEGDSASARATFDGKFWAQYNAAKHGARHINPGGSITFFSGIFSRRPGKGFSALAANNTPS